jgi:hypothetical protein
MRGENFVAHRLRITGLFHYIQTTSKMFQIQVIQCNEFCRVC